MTGSIRELRLGPEEAEGWAPSHEYVWRMARWIHAVAPRGKGWIPRRIGQLAGDRLRAEIRTASGGRLVVDPTSLEVFAYIDTHGGLWEGHDVAACRAVLEPGQVFYDVGANAGLFTIELAASFGGAIDVRAFEPQPSLARSVALSAARNGFTNVHVYQVMLGDQEGESRLFVPACSIHASAVTPSPRAQTLSCLRTTIDAAVASGAVPAPQVIKMDVEGGELAVVHGAMATLANHRPAVLFESDVNQERFGYTRADLCGALRRCAPYRFFAVERGGGFAPLDAKGAGPARRADSVLAIAEDRLPAVRLGA
jgi:FkbM family methyltransferase